MVAPSSMAKRRVSFLITSITSWARKDNVFPKDFIWDELNLDTHGLHELDAPVIEDEVKEAINQNSK